MRQKFEDVKFRPESLQLVQQCNAIIANYGAQGLRLTLRQLYYQLVTVNAVVNTERSYKNVGSIISKARLAGLVDWDAIEDRVRVPRTPQEFEDLSELVEAAARSYRLPRWNGQEHYIELWVEKDALSGVLRPIAREYHVTLMVNRGYSSQSAMYEAAAQFMENNERKPVLLYLGDHDPSGEDMVRDIRDRLLMFGVDDIVVTKLALTMKQVQQYNPPPNPAKMTDTRAEGYVALHGRSSWEVDALPPNVLVRIVRSAIKKFLDESLMEEIKEQEQKDIEKLRAAAEGV